MHNSFKNLPFFKWYFKNTRNKIVFFIILFLLSLGYSLLHRPISLIVWDSFRYEKELQIMQDSLYEVWQDEERFLKLYHSFYEKEHINIKIQNLQNEILRLIDNLESDLLFSTLFGIEEVYLQALVHKVEIYRSDLDWKISLFVFRKYRLTQQQIDEYIYFATQYQKLLFFINKLDESFFTSAIKIDANAFVMKFGRAIIYLMTKQEQCLEKNTNLIFNMMEESYNAIYRFKNTPMEQYLHKGYLDTIQDMITDTKGAINDCQ